MTPLGSRDLMRAINRSTILNTIKTQGPIDRASIARGSGLSPATVTGITAELIEDGLVFEKEPGDSRGGRRPILLALNPHGGFVIGIKLTETQLVGALTDLEATVIVKHTLLLADQSLERVIAGSAELVDRLLAAADLPRKKLLGVGVGLAGIVDSHAGLLRRSPFFGWKDLPLRDLVQERVGVPVYVDNDVNTLTLAEKLFGAGQGVNNFLTITVGRGIGMGLVVNGQIYRGAGGGAGELGHTVVDPQGAPCACGNRGCLETFVGEPGLLESANRLRPAAPLASLDGLVELAEQGDAVAQEVLSAAGRILGAEVANLVNLLNPQRIIFGGEGVCLGRWLFDPMRETLRQHVFPTLLDDVQIRIDAWGDDAWARGAASLVLQELFASPVHSQASAETV